MVQIGYARKMLALGLGLVLLTGCQKPRALEKKSVVGFYFDTVITLSAYVEDDQVLKEALDECARYDKLFSRTVQGSDVWRINSASGPVEVSPETAEMLRLGQEYAVASDGAFDMTVEPETKLWSFESEDPKLPDPEALRAAAGRVDYRKLQIDGNTVTLPDGMGLELGGIAKGFIADKLYAFLKDRGVTSGLINLGGSVMTIGRRATDDKPWVVGIQDPKSENGTNKLAVRAEDLSVDTSGNYERYFILDGVRYHHLLDPKTGWPAQVDLDSVTIVAPNATLADTLSTACYVMGLEEGMALVERYDGAEAVFIKSDGSVVMTDGARALIESGP